MTSHRRVTAEYALFPSGRRISRLETVGVVHGPRRDQVYTRGGGDGGTVD